MTTYNPNPAYSSEWFVQGFEPTIFTTNTVVFTPGAARNINNNFVIQYPPNEPGFPASITLTQNVGLNGCYPLPISAVTPTSGIQALLVLAIGNSAGTTGGSLNDTNGIGAGLIIDTSPNGSPSLPAGYDSAAPVGLVLIDTSGNFVPFCQTGGYHKRTIMFQDAQQILTAGAAITPTAVNLSGQFLPGFMTNLNLLYTFTPTAAADIAKLIPQGLTSATTAPVQIKGQTAAVAETGQIVMPIGTASGNYGVNYSVTQTSDSLSLWLAGFDYEPPFLSIN